MALDQLTLKIVYNLKDDKFNTGGNIKKEAYSDLITGFLMTQIGKGKDDKKAILRDVYNITIEFNPNEIEYRVSDDTNNKGLRDGILLHFCQTL